MTASQADPAAPGLCPLQPGTEPREAPTVLRTANAPLLAHSPVNIPDWVMGQSLPQRPGLRYASPLCTAPKSSTHPSIL